MNLLQLMSNYADLYSRFNSRSHGDNQAYAQRCLYAIDAIKTALTCSTIAGTKTETELRMHYNTENAFGRMISKNLLNLFDGYTELNKVKTV